MADFQGNTCYPGIVSFKQVWPKRIDHCFISCTASGPNESRRAHKQFPPLAQAQAIFEVRVQPPRILGCLTLGSKPSLPARANIQSRKPALHRKILHRVRQCLANLSVFEQMGKMNGEQARKGGAARNHTPTLLVLRRSAAGRASSSRDCSADSLGRSLRMGALSGSTQ